MRKTIEDTKKVMEENKMSIVIALMKAGNVPAASPAPKGCADVTAKKEAGGANCN